MKNVLNLSWRRSLFYRNQPIDLQNKSMDWFLYDKNLRHESINVLLFALFIEIYSLIMKK